jgi:predicted RNA binding protein YcfA (HicA-like mRNA interferase family)
VKTRELRRLLAELGCVEVRQSGSHLIVRCNGGCQTVIPIHAGDISPGTLRNIERMLEPCLGKGWLG